MHLHELRLQNFRCFTDTTISFDERLTVLVGKNGSGKTAILDAAAIALNRVLSKVHGIMHFSHISISQNDKPNNSSHEIKTNIKCRLLHNNKNILLSIDEMPKILRDTKFEQLWHENIPELPIYAYFTGIRIQKNSDISFDKTNINQMRDPTAAYANCFQPSLSFGDTLAWIDTHDADEARRFRDGDEDYRDPELSAMREAVEKALPDFGGLRFRGTTNEILVTRKTDGQKLSFWQLSDGYRAMLALILDLARRMAIANGERYTAEGRSILSSPAIVLIDEIELHLHPGWQQTVLPSLLEIFPNTQFIVSTHSPQVLSSIASKHIRLLDEGEVYAAPEGTEGAESSRILKRIFGVLPRPPKNKFAEALARYQTLVEADLWDSDEAKQLRATLDANFQGQEPALQEADLYIENRKWELADEEN